jgi:hypothetical protein
VCQQGLRQQRIEFLGPGKKADEDDTDGDQRPDQAVAQLDQVRKKGIFGWIHLWIRALASAARGQRLAGAQRHCWSQ